MTEPVRKFEVVGEDDGGPKSQDNAAALNMLMLGLKALSQRTLIALADLFALMSVASAFFLWWSIPSPNTQQLIGLGMYATFVLAMIYLVRRK